MVFGTSIQVPVSWESLHNDGEKKTQILVFKEISLSLQASVSLLKNREGLN